MADQKSSKLLDQVRDAIRLKQYAGEAYVDWIKRFILYLAIRRNLICHYSLSIFMFASLTPSQRIAIIRLLRFTLKLKNPLVLFKHL
jgi:hypothetical protein